MEVVVSPSLHYVQSLVSSLFYPDDSAGKILSENDGISPMNFFQTAGFPVF